MTSPLQSSLCRRGFSLAEILIAMAIMGVLTTLTVPSILNSVNSNRNSKQSAMAKDTALMILSAYQQYRSANATVPTNMVPSALTPYMNYIKLDTSGTQIDAHPTGGAITCNSSTPCIKLHNGGTLLLASENFAGSNTTNCIQFDFDPDSVYSGTASDNPGKSLQFEFYYDGTIRTRGTAKANSCHSVVCTFGPNSAYDPSWFTGF